MTVETYDELSALYARCQDDPAFNRVVITMFHLAIAVTEANLTEADLEDAGAVAKLLAAEHNAGREAPH